ncbi:MAG TPA: hypothetical protein VMR41_02865 [Patescibacteria group bacterium]|nr:hypothetical protein [Patescibacteria group bacterium]
MKTDEKTDIKALKNLLAQLENRLSDKITSANKELEEKLSNKILSTNKESEERLSKKFISANIELEEKLSKKIVSASKELKLDLTLNILNVEQNLRKDIERLEKKLTDTENRILTTVDPLLSELETRREDRELGAFQINNIKNQIIELEKRVKKLEKIQTSS